MVSANASTRIVHTWICRGRQEFYYEAMRAPDVNITRQRKIRRVHFHEFMLNVHERIHKYKQKHPRGDAVPAVAFELAKEARVLCFDEFQVTDIADAMILRRLFGLLWEYYGVVVVATSNRAPSELYEGGINRNIFLPFIDTLHKYLEVVHIPGEHDYRREPVAAENEKSSSACYFWPCNDSTVREAMDHLFKRSYYPFDDDDHHIDKVQNKEIPVRMGRAVQIPRATESVAWFHFDELCGKPLGPADYLAICEHFSVVMVDHVPQLNSQKFNEARRFVALIDALYETKTKLIMASEVPLEDLFQDFDVVVESKDGDEEMNAASGDDIMFVKGQGGSSSSAATTMIRTKDGGEMEWSATGRIGVSLAQFSAVQDVAFSFRRAESRLVEMNKSSWGVMT